MRAYPILVFLFFGLSLPFFVALAFNHNDRVKPADSTNPLEELISGEAFLPADVRALQDDEFDNPGYIAVESGEQLFAVLGGPTLKSCRSCHDAKATDFRRAVASYPKFSPERRDVITLGQRINLCRERNLKTNALPDDAPELSSLSVYLRSAAKGLPSGVEITGTNEKVFEKGKTLFSARIGLLNLSCAQCHSANVGQRFGSETLSQGHPSSSPTFKVSSGRITTLHDRFRACNKLTRAEPQPENAADYVALELYISWRSKNLPLSAPGVRP